MQLCATQRNADLPLRPPTQTQRAVREKDSWKDAPKAAAERALPFPTGLGEGGQAALCVGPCSLPRGSMGNASLTPLQPRSLLAQVPGAVTQSGSLKAPSMPSYLCLKTYFLLFRTIPTDTMEDSGSWGSEAGAQDAASQTHCCLTAPCLSASTHGSRPRPRLWGEEC